MKIKKMHCMSTMVAVLMLLCFGITPLAAESPPKNNWEFGTEVYLWGASIGGQTPSGSNIDIHFDDLFDNLEMAFMGTFDARKDRWSILADVIYLDVKDEKSTRGISSSVELTGWILTPLVGYTLVDKRQGNLILVGGARYLYLDADLRAGSRGISDSGDVWDGIVGIKSRVNLSEKWYLSCYLDIGTP